MAVFELGNRFLPQASLAVEVLRSLLDEPALALKGGTAINLFYRNLPRLSVDLDLVYLPVEERAASHARIAEALNRVGGSIQRLLRNVRAHAGETAKGKLIVHRGRTSVTVEVNLVLRGSVYPAEVRQALPAAQDAFGDVTARLLSFEDLFAGKIVAALDRQHPRDLFDVKLLLEAEGISDALFRAFLVYLISHDGSLARVIHPAPKPIGDLFEKQFRYMSAEPVTLEELDQARADLIAALHGKIGDGEKTFLLSFKRGAPRWELLGVEHAPELPAVRWKLQNLDRMTAERRSDAIANLERVLERI